MKKKFEYEFEEQSQKRIIFESNLGDEFDVIIDGARVGIHANKSAYLALAKLMVKLALSDLEPNYHLHLSKDFDDDHPDIIWFGVGNRQRK